jgi:hypothetical protein
MALVAAFRGLRRNAALLDRSGMFVDQVRSISKQIFVLLPWGKVVMRLQPYKASTEADH